ncbi:hypothetical protein BASA81_001141 [Batrachochytrium salamandrivorans]|nr:hypothetical protein BASA81_001141 [Batrachochytrium salamandrivorans]
MKNTSSPFNAKPTTTTPSPSSYSAAVYRSLELPLSTPSPLPFAASSSSTTFKAFQGARPTVSKGEATWTFESSDFAPTPPTPGLFAMSPNCIELPRDLPCNKLVELVNQTMAKHHIDVLDYAEFVWTCSTCMGFVETKFVMRLFACSQLDFQRESGCAYVFNSLFADLQRELAVSGSNKPLPTLSPRREFKVLALPKELADEESIGDAGKEANNALVHGLCESPHLDVQREGLTKLARLLEHDDAQVHPCHRLLQGLVKANDPQVRRLAVTNLGLLNAGKQIQCEFDQSQVQALVSVLVNEHELPETRRQAGCLLRKLTSCKFAPLVKLSAIPLCSAKFICPDAQLMEIVRDLRTFLEA